MKDGYWVVRTYEAGQVGEKTKYFVLGDRTRRNRRKEESSIKKQEQNEYSAKKRLARLINANFTHGDILLGLDYSDASYKKLERSARKAAPDYDSLPEEYQKAFDECAAEALKECNDGLMERQDAIIEKMVAEGHTIVEVDTELWKEAAMDSIKECADTLAPEAKAAVYAQLGLEG